MKQVFARIGAAAAAFLALTWVLWPDDWSKVFAEPEPIVSFVVAVSVWIFSEFKDDKGELFDRFTPSDEAGCEILDATDRKVAGEFFKLFTPEFKEVFGGNEFPRFFPKYLLDSMRSYRRSSEQGWFKIADNRTNELLQCFSSSINELLDHGVYAFDWEKTEIIDVRPEIYYQDFVGNQQEAFESCEPAEIRRALMAGVSSRMVKSGGQLVERIRAIDPALASELLEKHHGFD